MDWPVYYYVFERKGQIYGWLATDQVNTHGRMVSKEEFIELGGNPNNVRYSDNYYNYLKMQQELEQAKLTEAKIKAASEQNDFLEECIAEMAGIVYNFDPSEPKQ